MTMIRVSPLDVQVRCDWFDGRPRSIRMANEVIPVLAVTRVRRESAAYSAALGPRTVFEVLTEAGRYALVYRHRARRWVVEGVEPIAGPGAPASLPTHGLARAA
jgi:hypothetical protein